MDKEVNYSGITRRIVAYTIDSILWIIIVFILAFSLFSLPSSLDNLDSFDGTIMTRVVIMAAILLISYLSFSVLMVVRFGGTPGKLLCGIYIKDANTFKNVTLMQATIRCILSGVILSSTKIFGCGSILPILVTLFAVRDKRKQALHDKIAKTVVINYKPTLDSVAQESDSVS